MIVEGAKTGMLMNTQDTTKELRDAWLARADGWLCAHCGGNLRRIPSRPFAGFVAFDFECLDSACLAVHGQNHFDTHAAPEKGGGEV